MRQTAGYRTTFYKELPDSAGHSWYVPIWSRLMPTADHSEALEQAICEFERTYTGQWNERAAMIEIDEAVSCASEVAEAPRAKRIVRG